jgi:hypothetical protein
MSALGQKQTSAASFDHVVCVANSVGGTLTTSVFARLITNSNLVGRLISHLFARRIPLECIHNFQSANGCPK